MDAPSRSYRGKTSAARQAERRRLFIQAGCEVFGTVGYHAATVKQLCQAAGLTERYFYQTFGKRHRLFAACYDQQLDELLAAITATLARHQSESIHSLARAGLQTFFDQMQSDRQMARILLIEIYGVPYDQQRLFRRSIGRFSDLIQQTTLTRAVGQTTIAFDADLLSAGLVGVCIQMALRWVVDGYRQPPQRLVDHCMLIFDGLASRLTQPGTSAGR